MSSHSTKDVAELGRIMGIWAHPDDETWMSGGIMAIARKNKQPVCCISATKGELGNQDPDKWQTNRLGLIREKELQAALDLLGVSCHHWLGFKDADCENVSNKSAVAKIIPIIQEFQPDTILTFGPTGTTGHPDHITVGAWAKQALQALDRTKTNLLTNVVPHEWYTSEGMLIDKKINYYFNIDTPPLALQQDIELCITLPDEILVLKLAALRAQTSQTEKLFAQADLDDIKNMIKTECFNLASF